jgi:dienelactone hydrolase
VAALSGVPAVAVALGFVPHWIKGGSVIVRGAALVRLGAGLFLVVTGTGLATRTRGRVRRVVSLVGAFVVTGLVAFVIAPAVLATNVPEIDLGASPSSVGLEFEDVSLRTSDGVTLATWYVPSSNGAAVVLRHGAGSTRSDVLDVAEVLARAGFGVLLIDARGHGDSGGDAMDFGWHGDADIEAATRDLAARPDVDPGRIGVVGMSMGGEEAIGASGSNAEIRAVVAEGATVRNAADEAWLSDRHGFPGLVQEQLERVQDTVIDVLTDASVPTSLRAAVESSDDVRYLLITAGEVPDEQHAAAHIASGAPDRVETWTVEGAAHTGGLETEPDEWTERVVDFLTDALLAHANADG